MSSRAKCVFDKLCWSIKTWNIPSTTFHLCLQVFPFCLSLGEKKRPFCLRVGFDSVRNKLLLQILLLTHTPSDALRATLSIFKFSRGSLPLFLPSCCVGQFHIRLYLAFAPTNTHIHSENVMDVCEKKGKRGGRCFWAVCGSLRLCLFCQTDSNCGEVIE